MVQCNVKLLFKAGGGGAPAWVGGKRRAAGNKNVEGKM